MPDLAQIHPSVRVRPSGGDLVAVDMEMLPVVRAIWDRGWATLGSCQDLGETARHGGAPGGERTAAYYSGYAWLKLPNSDAEAFLAAVATYPILGPLLSPETAPEHWSCFTFRDGRGLFAATQVFFPSDQIDQVAAITGQPLPP